MSEKYEITEKSFELVQNNETIHDTKFETKRIGFFKDALHRFRKNKGSVVAGIIILFMVLFAIVSPIISKHDLNDKDIIYQDRSPLIRGNENGGFWDGGQTKTVSGAQYRYYLSIAKDTGFNPVTKVFKVVETEDSISYKIRLNSYFVKGARYITLSKDEYKKICEYQNETGKQVLLPYVDFEKLANGYSPLAPVTDEMKQEGKNRKYTDANYCYKFTIQGVPKIGKDGGFEYVYSAKGDSGLFQEYNSIRVDSDPAKKNPKLADTTGYAYAKEANGELEARVCSYTYYEYTRGETPQYLFGTDKYGKDIFYALGAGARFSLILAVCVSTINFILGTIYGSIEGYYGGAADLIMERVSDILSGVPLMIVVTLFNLHLADKVGVIPAFLLAFVATGWIGTASLVRKQFYRFKGQEYVLASRTLGAKDFRIMFKHVFPNSLGTIVTSSVLVIPGVIGSETMLTYLGIINLSASGKITSVGALMADANGSFDSYPHELFFPALYLSLLMICFNLFGNGLRDAFNPALRGQDE